MRVLLQTWLIPGVLVGYISAVRALAQHALTEPDDPLLAQDAEVLGDVLLRRADRVGQLLHGRLPLPEQVEQLDPRRVGEHAEAARDQLDQLVGKRMLRHNSHGGTQARRPHPQGR